jgi:hypothetical protein
MLLVESEHVQSYRLSLGAMVSIARAISLGLSADMQTVHIIVDFYTWKRLFAIFRIGVRDFVH